VPCDADQRRAACADRSGAAARAEVIAVTAVAAVADPHGVAAVTAAAAVGAGVPAVTAVTAGAKLNPMLARSEIAHVITSGAAITNAIPHLSPGHQQLICTPKA
jgi:hypothetical protein